MAAADGFMKLQDWDKAIAAYSLAAEQDPELVEGWFGIGLAQFGKARQPCEAAYAPLKRCVELDPNHAQARCCLGRVLLARGDARRAEEHFRASIRLDATIAVAHQGLAPILQQRGDLDGAIRAMLEYVRLSGDPDGSGEANVAKLRAQKKAGGRALPPSLTRDLLMIDPEAQARFPPPCRARAAAARSCD